MKKKKKELSRILGSTFRSVLMNLILILEKFVFLINYESDFQHIFKFSVHCHDTEIHSKFYDIKKE